MRSGLLAEDEVVVRRGDTLWGIAARRLGPSASDARIAAEWPRWYAANRAVIGDDPDRLRPGQRLQAPALTGPWNDDRTTDHPHQERTVRR
jgi:nucleoid-associated protein YgaU